MALTKDQKKAQVKDLTQKLKDAQSVMFAHYIGLTVADVSDFRKKLREGDAEMKVAKKTLIKLAAKEAGLPDVEPDALDGPVSCIFSFGDALTGAQVAFTFGKDHEQVELIGGIFEGKILSKEEAIALAKMPSRDVLLATFVSMLKSPQAKFVSLCSSPLGGFARALSQLAEKGGSVEEETSAKAGTEENTPAPVAEDSKDSEDPEEQIAKDSENDEATETEKTENEGSSEEQADNS